MMYRSINWLGKQNKHRYTQVQNIWGGSTNVIKRGKLQFKFPTFPPPVLWNITTVNKVT